MKHYFFLLLLFATVLAACGTSETTPPTNQPINQPAVQATALPRPGKFILAVLL